MQRALKVCSHPTCSSYAPCPTHGPKPWQGSRRREHTVSGYEQQRRAQRVIYRDDTRCHWCGRIGGTQVDHVIPLEEGGKDDESNLAPIHVDCHQEKTLQEAARGRERAR